ncbi:MAG: molecular chaperone DnaJ [Candidatus Pacebacteria bacterium]|jgi:molecular chaperone DnaJ|nr:molecular chaperone DnaJ [bacterium]MDP6527756.1 molecular chaperone DnaJ [Candidatus Paceibacterota bacterium]MDP6659593.1 molecular chaperone DnaJ [Candidatus Paceibacterota bacterium]|tara:strand:- start:26571 stop:27638 length:1068 start_codon:yes stop_codon:yes gene_type:complete
MPHKDYYEILGVDKKASKEDIKKAFRKLAHQYHPDKKDGNEARFKEASDAYSVLSDDKKRAEYDAYGRVFSGAGGAQGGAGFDGFDFSGFQQGGFEDFDIGDIFGDIFGGGRERQRRGRDISIDLTISFKDSVFGIERKILVTKTSNCEVCEGSGAESGSEMESCNACNGKGQIHETRSSLLGTFTSVRTCTTCGGAGKVPKVKCKSCKGHGVLRKEQEIAVAIPAGINDGEMIRLTGAGEALKGAVSGDLYIKIHVEPHERFRKEGNNLVTELSVKLSDALLGSDYSLETLEGAITVKVPAGVSVGEILRVRGKGIPNRAGVRGDLLIKIKVPLPKKLSRSAKKKVEELREEGI